MLHSGRLHSGILLDSGILLSLITLLFVLSWSWLKFCFIELYRHCSSSIKYFPLTHQSKCPFFQIGLSKPWTKVEMIWLCTSAMN